MNLRRCPISAAAALILLLLACNAPFANSPRAIPTGTLPAPATETPTATPTPSPTPTPLPIQAINQGERDLRNGDWDAAVIVFQQVLSDPGATAEEVIAARLGLAQAALRRGDYASARGALDAFLVQHPDHAEAARAYFLRGEARMGLSDWGGAIGDFQTYLALRPGLIDSYVYERIADSYLALGQTEQALAAYDLALAADRHTVGLLQLRERVASVHRLLGNTDQAIAQYQLILSVAERPNYRASIEFLIGQTLLETGRLEEAYEQFNRVFMTYPKNREALDSLRALLGANYQVDQFQRGLVNYYSGQYEIAISAFYNYLAGTPIDYPPDAHLYIAYCYRRLGNTQAALTELQALITRFDPEDGTAWGDAWLEMADLYAASGDLTNAYTTYEQLIAEHPTLPQAVEAIYRLGVLAESQGDLARAANYYQRLSIEAPADVRAPEGIFRVGLLAYRQGDYVTAETLFRAAAALPANERPAASYLWLGKTLQAAGRAEEAAVAFNTAITTDGELGYYGLRAADLLAGRLPFTAPSSVNLEIEPDEGREEAERWLVARFGLAETPPLAATLRADLAGDPRMQRGIELWKLGLPVDAKPYFEAVRRAFENDPLATYQLAVFFREIGLYRSSILAAWRLHRLAGVGPLEAPAFIARLRYPVYFSDLVQERADEYELDVLYVFALIWQESNFEGFAVSSSAAQGLMQIWPPTGEDIAARLAWPNYQLSDLQRPYVNVAFGTWLLREELNRFGGDPYAALAAYNAGPGNTATWKGLAGGDFDLFVEVITLDEPQLYITRIYEHYAVYRALYGIP